MKNLFALLALTCLIAFSVVSCAPTPANDPGDPNFLQSTPDTVKLTPTIATATAGVSLHCGCTFPLIMTNKGGDTTHIQYLVTQYPADVKTHDVTVTANVTGLTTGIYTGWISFRAVDADVNNTSGMFYDTLHVTLKIP
jgi:hypothetical protein